MIDGLPNSNQLIFCWSVNQLIVAKSQAVGK